MKIWYFENTHQDKSNDILYDIIYLCILVEKYGQSKLGQNSRFSNVSTIAERSEYIISDIPEEYLAQGQKCQFLYELVCGHAFGSRVVIQEGQ